MGAAGHTPAVLGIRSLRAFTFNPKRVWHTLFSGTGNTGILKRHRQHHSLAVSPNSLELVKPSTQPPLSEFAKPESIRVPLPL
jgi:hypothetical protein